MDSRRVREVCYAMFQIVVIIAVICAMAALWLDVRAEGLG